MTLYRQLLMLIAGLMLLMFAGTLWVNIDSSRRFLEAQLGSHAQDTATWLGLSLTHSVENSDVADMELLIDAVFDRGYYGEIVLRDRAGKTLVERRLPTRMADVPQWFVGLLPLTTPEGDAVVMSGWREVASLRVRSHPGYAYSQLWGTALHLLGWFGLTALTLSGLGGVLLGGILRPLRDVERQAEAVAERRYDVQIVPPRTRELRTVVEAMNRMTRKVQEAFEEQSRSAERLREMAFGDTVTGLGNRRYFDSQMQARLRAGNARSGEILVLIHLDGLQALNDRLGFGAGDRLLKAAADILREESERCDTAILARLSGADFGLLLVHHAGTSEAEALAGRLCERIAALHAQGLTPESGVVHIGLALHRTGIGPGGLLAEGDLALRTAQSAGANCWHARFGDSDATQQGLGRGQWGEFLRTAIAERRMLPYVQPAVWLREGGATLHYEVLVRIPDADGRPLAAGMVLPMAEELGLSHMLDECILEVVLDTLRHQPVDRSFAINLAPNTLRDANLLDWLLTTLAGWKGPKLAFEVPESGVVRAPHNAREFAAALRSIGVGFGLDHFGQGFSAFGYLKVLRPDYVKIDSAYTARLAEDYDNQFFVETLVGVAHSLDIRCIAEAIEEDAQRELLQRLGVDGIQGFLVGRPEPLPPPG